MGAFKSDEVVITISELFQDKAKYIEAIHSVVELHGTVTNEEERKYVPSYVVNHGVLPGTDLHKLLRSAKVCIHVVRVAENL